LSAGQELVVDLVLTLPSAGWKMEVERGTGLPILVGAMPRSGIEITIVDPFGNISRTFSGSKPEYGLGGFETWASLTGTYHIRFLDQAFEVPMSGQFTRLTFTEEEGAQGMITGVVRDQTGAPQPGRQINLSGIEIARTASTGPDGGYRFDGLPAGTYTLSVVGTNLTQTVQSDGQSTLNVDLTLPPSAGGEWAMEVTRGSGLPLLVGSLPEPGVTVAVTDPFGSTTQVVSGSKSEYGVGGFETYARYSGTYTIQFLDQTFSLQMEGQFTRVTFIRGVPIETRARLVSSPLPFADADAWFDYFESNQQTRGLFKLEEL
jgi:hypothetical protein